MRIRKAVIPVAGLGTRFLPFTKVIPKEMLPVIDIPSIQFIIEEALSIGIDNILFVSSREKRGMIEDYFDKHFFLERFLKESNQEARLADLKKVPENFKIFSVRQREARGLGDAILHAEGFVSKDEYFAVFLPDDIIFSDKPAIKQMLECAEKHDKGVVAVEKVSWDRVSSYGIIKPKKAGKREHAIVDMVEKPTREKAFSNLGIVGRYILPGSIFNYIKNTKPGVKGEIQITDALKALKDDAGLMGYEFEGKRCDTGNKYDYLLTTLYYASTHPEYKDKIKKDIKSIFKIK
jgi:UTP--glucose-1-phosphate uridylyltransferase